MLSELSRASSCASSVSNPGVRRRRLAERKPPSKTVATRASTRPAIFRVSVDCPSLLCPGVVCASMVAILLFPAGSARFRVFLARDRYRVMELLHGVHAAVGLSQQPFDVVSIFRTKRRAYAQSDHFAAAHMPS